MNIPQNITSQNYQECVYLFTVFFANLERTATGADEYLSDFSQFFQSTLPDKLSGLTSIDNFFQGDRADQLASWYSQLLEIWKSYQQLSLPYSQNLLDPHHDQKLKSLYAKLKSIKIE